MNGLVDVPVLGLILQLLDYMITVVTVNAPIIFALTVPIAFGALCGVMNERSGVVNIGIEGMMLASAFVGWFVASIVSQALVVPPGFIFGVTPALVIGVLAAVLCGMAVSAVHAWLSVSLRVDQIISGTIINIVALGVTGYLDVLLSTNPLPTAGKFAAFAPPDWLVTLPAIGWLAKALLAQGPITLSMLPIVIVLEVLLFRSRWGLRTRSVGEHPKAAETVGIDVIRMRYKNVIFGGIFAGLAGAWFTLDFGNSFTGGMTGGRGFIALAAMIFGRWRPVGALLAALLFAASSALGIAIRTTPPPGQLGDILSAIPEEFFAALPYIITIIVLAGAVGRSVAPAADGQPYERESAT